MWREALLARAVLLGQTKGYRHHPQLQRFGAQAAPVSAINAYLAEVYDESVSRGYSFDRDKVTRVRTPSRMSVTNGQLAYEWQHLLQKLSVRNPDLHEVWRNSGEPECHPLFIVQEGQVEPWERVNEAGPSP